MSHNNPENGKLVDGLDIPIVKLVPRNERVVISYEILDGCLRYRILLEMGVETVPCLIRDQREAFTCHKMVNHIIEKPKLLTQDEIIQILQKRHQQGGALKCISRDELEFHKSIVSKFRSLRLALIAAGIPTPTLRR